MKKEIAAYVARCDTCCRVKAIHNENCRVVATVISFGMEVGRGEYGLHHRIADYAERE